MKNVKNDQRSKFTRAMIKKSLLKLSATKQLNKITITELCADAGINRISFYNHFYDIYDVYEIIENDFFEELITKLQHMKSYDIEKSLIREIVLLLYRNIDFCNLIINTKNNFIQRIIKAFHEKYVSEISARYKKIPVKFLDSFYIFQFNGNLGLVLNWIENGMKESPEEMTGLIEGLNKFALDGISKYYEK